MKNPVQTWGVFSARGTHWAIALGVLLTTSSLFAQTTPDPVSSATANWLDAQNLSGWRIVNSDFGLNPHVSSLTATASSSQLSVGPASFAANKGQAFNPEVVPAPVVTNWTNTGTGNWFFYGNWSNGVPTSKSVAVVANGGTALIESDDASTLRRSITTADVGDLTIGSGNGPQGKGTVLEDFAELDVFRSLTVEANGALQSFTGPAVNILRGGTVTNSGSIIGATDGIDLKAGGTVVNNQTGIIEGGITESGGSTGTDAAAKASNQYAIRGTGGITNIANFGTISGPSAIGLFDTGSITNNAGGTITGLNGVAINATNSSGNTTVSNAGIVNGNVELGNGTNTVTLVTGGVIKGDLNLGSNSASQLVLDGSGQQNISQAVTGTITDPGSLTKQGSGIWIIDEDLTAPISTDVLAGTLNVAQNATLTSQAVTIAHGGTLTGLGTINGNVTNSGVISPGDPFGTLTVNGNFTQNSNGIFRLQLGGLAPGEFGVLNVTGHATLAGTLQLVRIGNFQFLPGDKLVFLTANGVTGSFTSTINPNSIVKAQVILLPNAVELVGTQGSFVQFVQFACNPNSAAVAQSLDNAVGNPSAAALITFLDGQPTNQLCADFTLISPEQLTAIFNLEVSLANIQTANLERRLEDIRAGSKGFSSSGFTFNGTNPSFTGGLSGPTGTEGKGGPAALAPIPENRWGFFATGLGEFTDVSSDNGARGFNLRTGGITLGVDYRIGSNFAIGLTGGYAHTGVDLSGNGSIDADGGTGGLYATAFGGGFYVDTSVTAGATTYDTHRAALLGTANGNTEGATVNVLIAGGYDWTKGNLTIGPIASFQYTYAGMDGFTESGSLAPLKFGDQSADSMRTAFGVKASYDWKIGGVLIKPELRASWQHEFGDSSYSIVANFANGAGTNFTTNGPRIGRDSLLIGAGVAMLWNDRISSYIYYDGELARTNYDSHSVTAGFRISF